MMLQFAKGRCKQHQLFTTHGDNIQWITTLLTDSGGQLCWCEAAELCNIPTGQFSTLVSLCYLINLCDWAQWVLVL